MPTRAFADDLRQVVARARPVLEAMAPADAARAPAPGKWSPVQIIGHLIDSASNNHQRFVRARFRTDLRFPGYDQDRWVDAQAWATAPWRDTVELWATFNLHLAHVMDATPQDVLDRPRHEHNLDQIALHPVPADQPATLAYLMADYVTHQLHHLAQIHPTQP